MPRPKLSGAAVLAGAVALGAWGGLGVLPGIDYHRGRRLAVVGPLDAADRALDAGARGFDRFEALWVLGEVRLGRYDALAAKGDPGDTGARWLTKASEAYLDAARACPASSWAWSGLAQVYARAERLRRSRKGTDLTTLGSGDPWSPLGREARVAVGLARFAAEREPQVFRHWDELSQICLGFGLEGEAREALRRSAEAEPDWLAHETIDWDRVPRDMALEFADTSWRMVGKTPLLRPERHLVVLGQLERRLGRLDRAEDALRRAMREKASALERAEEHFHLGLVLADRGRLGDAASELEAAATHPRFAAPAAFELAGVWEKAGDPEKARRWIESARGREPSNARYAAQAARMAMRRHDWAAAIEAWRWVLVVDPRAGWAAAALAESYLEAGKPGQAEEALEAARKAGADPSEIETLRARIGGGPGSPR